VGESEQVVPLPNPDAKVFILNKPKASTDDPFLNVFNPIVNQLRESSFDKTV